MGKLKIVEELFKGRHFDRGVVILGVRWYLRYKLSLRDLVEMMAERGLAMATTATSGRSRPSCCAYSLERGARGLKPAQRSSERFARDGYLHLFAPEPLWRSCQYRRLRARTTRTGCSLAPRYELGDNSLHGAPSRSDQSTGEAVPTLPLGAALMVIVLLSLG